MDEQTEKVYEPSARKGGFADRSAMQNAKMFFPNPKGPGPSKSDGLGGECVLPKNVELGPKDSKVANTKPPNPDGQTCFGTPGQKMFHRS